MARRSTPSADSECYAQVGIVSLQELVVSMDLFERGQELSELSEGMLAPNG